MDLYASVTRVDEFRRVSTTEWASEDMLAKSISERTPLGWQGLYGEALHAGIEATVKGGVPLDGFYEYTSREGARASWPGSIVNACADAWPKPCVFERRCHEMYRLADDVLEIGGRIDAAHGVVIVEGKTKFGYFVADDYAESLQWRFYLDANPWARCVEYRVHEIGGMYADKNTGELRISRNGIVLDDIHAFRVWRQDGIRDELVVWMERFVEWAKRRRLTPHLRPWREAA